MAVQLTIDIDDTELAKLTEWLDILIPGKTPAEKKALMERHAKTLMKEDLLRRIRVYRAEETQAQELAARQDEGNEVVVDPVFNTQPAPPPL